MQSLRDEIGKLPAGFDETRFRELQELREELRPKNETAISLKSALNVSLPCAKKPKTLSRLSKSRTRDRGG